MPTNADLMKECRSRAKLFGVLFWLGALSVFANHFYVPLKRLGAGLYLGAPGTAAEQLLALLGDLAPALALLMALHAAWKLFLGFSKGALLDEGSAGRLGDIGTWIIVAMVLAALGNVDSLSRSFGVASLAVLAALGLALSSLAKILQLAAHVRADAESIV